MATLKEAINEIEKGLSEIDGLARFVGTSIHSETLDRIFTKGIASDGSSIGEYAESTISLKKKEGRFTSKKVNLRDSEKLVGSYIFNFKGNVVLLGFREISRGDGTTNKKIVDSLEGRYGDIFSLTSEENKLIDELTDDYLDKIL